MRPYRLAVAVALSTLVACSAEPLVAKGEGVAIPTADVQARIDRMAPAERARLQSLDARRALVEDLALGELQARAAERAGLKPETPDAAGKRRMVHRFLLQKFASPEGAKAIPEEELRRAYQEGLAEFVRPVRQGVLHLFFAAPAGSGDRARREALARKVHARIVAEERADPDSTEVFQRAGVELMDAQPGVELSDLGPLSRDELAGRFTPEIAARIWDGVGNRTSAVLATDRGFHVVKFKGGTPELNRSFEEVRELLAERLQRARSAREYPRWLAELREAAGVVVDEAEVARLVVPGDGAPTASAGPTQDARALAAGGSRP